MLDHERQRLLDEEHLRLLRIGYLIAGGMTAFMALFGMLYLVMGVFLVIGTSALPHRSGDVPPEFMGWFFLLFGFVFLFLGGIVAVLKFLTARALRLRKSRVLCLITAGFTCLGIPYGTALGIFTFAVLNRPSVLPLFEAAGPPIAPPSAYAPTNENEGPVA